MDFVLEVEGGLSDHTEDPGGLTNFGVTQAVYDYWRRTSRLPTQSVSRITRAEVDALYFRDYWTRGRCQFLPWPLSLVHFDSMVQHGRAPWLLQEALGVTQDGKIGPQTINAAQPKRARELAEDLIWVRISYYREQKRIWPTFSRGWMDRMVRLRRRVVAR